MQLREILRMMGNLPVTIAPEGVVCDGVSSMTGKDIGPHQVAGPSAQF